MDKADETLHHYCDWQYIIRNPAILISRQAEVTCSTDLPDDPSAETLEPATPGTFVWLLSTINELPGYEDDDPYTFQFGDDVDEGYHSQTEGIFSTRDAAIEHLIQCVGTPKKPEDIEWRALCDDKLSGFMDGGKIFYTLQRMIVG